MMMKYFQPVSILWILLLPAVTKTVDQGPCYMGKVLDNMLRLERTVSKLSIKLEVTESELMSTMKMMNVTHGQAAKKYTEDVAALNKKHTEDVLSLKRKLTSAQLKSSDNAKRLDGVLEDFGTKFSQINNLTLTGGIVGSVSFEVRQIADPLSVGKKQILKFDNVTLNKGGAYNPNSGIFIAPVNGTYIFWSNVMGYDSSAIHVCMHINTLTMYSYSATKALWGTASLIYITNVKKGQHVWFTMCSESARQIHGQYSSFGGTLLTTT